MPYVTPESCETYVHPALAIIDRQSVFASGSTIVLCSQTLSPLACIVRHVVRVAFAPRSIVISTAHVGIYGAICIQKFCTFTLKHLNEVLLTLAGSVTFGLGEFQGTANLT